MFGLRGAPTEGPVFASAAPGGGAGLSATITFAPPHDVAGALILNENAVAWPGLAPSSACPAAAGTVCGGFELQDGMGQWWPAAASLNEDASALVLIATNAPQGAVLNGTSNGFAVWPQVSLFASEALGGLPAYTWRSGL